MSIVAVASIDDMTSETNQRAILSLEVERHRCDFESALNNTLGEFILFGSSGDA